MIEKHDTGHFALMAENETQREDLASANRCWHTVLAENERLRDQVAKLQAIIDKQLY